MSRKGQMTWLGANIHWIMLGLLVGLIILAIIIDAQYQLPSNFKQKPITGIFKDIFLFLGIPSNWLYVPAVIYLFFVPFLGILVIVYGFLSEMKIFRVKRQVNLILAVLFAFATIPVGAFVKLVSLMFAVLSIYAVGAFGLLFFFGIIYIILERFGTWGFTRSTQYHELHLEHKYNQLRRWLLETFRDLSSHRNDEIAKEIKKVENWLTSGEQKYNTDARQGVQYLEGKASYLYGFLRKRHALVSEPPS